MAQFEVGNSGKPKGAKNRTTSKVRKAFSLLIENNLEQIEKDLKTLTAKDRIQAIQGLAKFVLPQLKALEISEDVGSKIPEIALRLLDLPDEKFEDV